MSSLAEEDLDRPESPLLVWGRRAGIALAALLIAFAIVHVAKNLGGNVQHAKKVAKISIVPNTPPPPPPKEEKKPEPPKESPKDVRIQPKEVQAPQPQQAEPLKMEGAAGDGPSPFKNGDVKNDYIAGPTTPGGAGGRMAFAFYTQQLQRHLQEELLHNRDLRRADYRVTVRIWIDHSGAISRAELMDSTGNNETDKLLRDALASIPALKDAPPDNMPQPLRVRITNRLTG